MKKILVAILLVFTVMLSLASCGEKPNDPSNNGAPDTSVSQDMSENGSGSNTAETTIPANAPDESVVGIRETFNTLEYAAYMNIFYEKKGDEYENKVYTKTGTFSVLRDEYGDTDRYYVWGYADKTRCCDWQWEFVPSEPSSLPKAGSYIKMKGKLIKDEKALDGYRYVDVTVTTLEDFTPADGTDLTVMSPTLARVQIANMQYKPEKFNGKNIRIFGRALNGSCLQHPYYDGSWNMDMVLPAGESAPSTGQYLTVSGTFTSKDGGSFIQVTSCNKY